MISSGPLTIVDSNGVRATGETALVDGKVRTSVSWAPGKTALVPSGTLQKRDDGTYYLPTGFDALEPGNIDIPLARAAADVAVPSNPSSTAEMNTQNATVVPLIAESLSVEKRVVETGGVRIHKVVRERQEAFDEPLFRENVRVERVPVGRIVDGPVATRQEGDTMIVALLEEVLVVEKRLLLKEELHITRLRETVRAPQSVTLRTEEAEIERFEASEKGADS